MPDEDAAVGGGATPRSDDSTARYGEEFAAQLKAQTDGLAPDEVAAVAALPSGSAMLIVRRGPAEGARFLLDTDVSIAGRHPEAEIFLDDVTVSRRHAEFRRAGTAFTVADLGSLNGTYLDQALLEGPAALSDGHDVQIGKFRLSFYASRLDLAEASA